MPHIQTYFLDTEAQTLSFSLNKPDQTIPSPWPMTKEKAKLLKGTNHCQITPQGRIAP
jgi:hypothetical protein